MGTHCVLQDLYRIEPGQHQCRIEAGEQRRESYQNKKENNESDVAEQIERKLFFKKTTYKTRT